MKKIDKNDPLLKYGGYASVMTAIVVVVVIVLNLAVSGFNIKFDLTKNKLYTLSEDTISLLENLKEDVNVYSLYAEGQEISMVTQILDRYASYSGHVKVSNVDPYKDPAFTAKYSKNGEQATIGSVVVETAGGFSVIPQDQVTDITVDQASQTAYIKGIKIESVLTGTIRKLTNGASEAVYELIGHGETAFGESLKTELGYSGFEVKKLDLIKEGVIPEDCGVLIINGPSSDFSSGEADSIKQYLENGGKAFITLGLTAAEMPNYDSVLADYGIADSGRIVIEGSANYALSNNPLYVIPEMNGESSICANLVSAGTNILMPAALGIDRLDAKRSTVDIQTLAETSQYSYARPVTDLGTEESMLQSENDVSGPVEVIVSVSDTDINGNENGTRLVVAGTEALLDDQTNSVINGGNFGFVMNAFDYLNGTESAGRTKSIGTQEYLNITQSRAIIIMFVSVIVIPLAILIAGFAVFIRRRNK